jgi:Zn-dependent protease
VFLEPQPTPYDLRFSVAGVPVRVHPFFWIVALLLGGTRDPRELLIWVGAVFASILIHEFGHVLAYRYFGHFAHVVLYSFGGLAVSSGGYHARSLVGIPRVVVSLAGPMAGFVLAGLLVVALEFGGNDVQFNPRFWPPIPRFAPLPSDHATELVGMLLWINIMWGVLNLLPIYPLDGGQVSMELMAMYDPGQGRRYALMASIFVAGCLAAYNLQRVSSGDQGGLYTAVLFGFLAYQNYVMLQQISGRGFGGRGW